MATCRKRSGGWEFGIALKGHARESRTFPLKADGAKWAREREAELAAGGPGRTIKKTLAEAFNEYGIKVSSGKRGERWELIRLKMFKRIIPFAGDLIGNITEAQIADWRDTRLKQVTKGSVRREMGLLSNVFEVARREWKWIKMNPCRDVRRPKDNKARTQRVPDDFVEKMIRALGGVGMETTMRKTGIAFLVALESGMRAKEICSIVQVDRKQRLVHLDETKNGTSRDVPLSALALELLPDGGLQMREATVDATFRRARAKVAKDANDPSLRKIRFHDSRREWLTKASKKLNVLELAKVSGHRDLKILLNTYYAPDITELADKLDRAA